MVVSQKIPTQMRDDKFPRIATLLCFTSIFLKVLIWRPHERREFAVYWTKWRLLIILLPNAGMAFQTRAV